MRENETTRVASVIAHAREGNRQGAIDALMQLWSEPPERDGIDAAAIDAWQVIEEIGAVAAVVTAGIALVRANRKIRRHAYIDLTEHASDAELSELADLVIAARWPVDPYLAAVFQRFAERNREDLLMAVVARHEKHFFDDDAAWQLVLYIMATSRIGNNPTLSSWFVTWQLHPRVEMWAVAAYAGTWFAGPTPADLTTVHLNALVTLSRDVLARLRSDDCRAFFVAVSLLGDIRDGRWAEVEVARQEHHELLHRARGMARVDHPIVRFANSLKHAHPVSPFQLGSPRAALPDTDDPRARLINRQLAEVVSDLANALDAVIAAIDLFLEMYRAKRGEPRVYELVHQMSALDKHGAGGWIRTAWGQLVRQRTSWHQRMRISLFR